jgi:glyceraldehyde 3-phosphate dehydrogenase
LIDDKKIKLLSEANPLKLPWKELGVELVLESSGRFTRTEEASRHLAAGAKKVIVSANSKTETMHHFVIGVNEKSYNPEKDDVVANCSCTTNCAAPLMKILNENFGLLKAQMTTVHAVTSTQNLVDGPNKDRRRGRAAFVNMVPTTTGAAKAVVRVLPELAGRISGSAIRVPVACGSFLEIIAQVERETTAAEINGILKKEAEGRLAGVLAVSEDQLVSSDIVGRSVSATVDLPLTEVLDLPGVKDENLVKLAAWYDNEWGYACRLAELAEYIGKKI